ncbi:MAG TPA: alpha/beta hydrolase [Solirubrobacterales bacterium]|jgi:pimeloyl-ACP methyl ester carboxylesterase
MPELSRPDGAQIHFEVTGDDGPAVVLASYWSWKPDVYKELLSDLASDHRVLTYHLRGSGDSSRNGPYEMEADVGDLEAVVEAAGGPVVMIATADSSNRSVKLAARRPELVTAVITFGTAPIARTAFEGQEGMLASDTVVDAFVEMLGRSYRGGMRTLMEATNPQMSADELRQRVHAQVEFCPQEAAVGRLSAWMQDDPAHESRALGDRLWIFAAAGVAGPWMPPPEELARLTRETLPDANVVQVEPGPISGPHETAEAIRRVTAALRADAPASRK